MHSTVHGTTCELDFYTAPSHAPASIEGSYDGVVTAAAVLAELEGKLDQWDGVSHDGVLHGQNIGLPQDVPRALDNTVILTTCT